MNDTEYWDWVADVNYNEKEGIKENSRKKRLIIKELLNYDFENSEVLEIGCGYGSMGAVAYLALGVKHYWGIDISPKFLEVANSLFSLDTKYGKATEIPFNDNFFDHIIFFDVLEHIKPEERIKTYQEINRVMKDEGLIFINSPLGQTQHNKDFDYGVGFQDYDDLMKITFSKLLKSKILSIPRYTGNGMTFYQFLVFGKGSYENLALYTL